VRGVAPHMCDQAASPTCWVGKEEGIWDATAGQQSAGVVALSDFMSRGVVIRTVINNFNFDGATKDPTQKAVRDALRGSMAATAQAAGRSVEGCSEGRNRAAKAKDGAAYLGRKPSYTCRQFTMARHMLGHDAVGIARIAKETGLTRQTIYRIKDDPAGAEAALTVWGL
jgi:putative DNA-invertase from lambdoid prophage Rac